VSESSDNEYNVVQSGNSSQVSLRSNPMMIQDIESNPNQVQEDNQEDIQQEDNQEDHHQEDERLQALRLGGIADKPRKAQDSNSENNDYLYALESPELMQKVFAERVQILQEHAIESDNDSEVINKF